MLELRHAEDQYIEMCDDDRLLFRYVYRSDVPAHESPRPYFHPLRTPAGRTVTEFRPADHPWHHGLSMTFTDVSGANFWGGDTFVEGKGYVMLDNHGVQRHLDWETLSVEEMVERIGWSARDGRHLLSEHRRISARMLDEGRWRLHLALSLTNITDAPLVFGSPTVAGRPRAGYGGLFWRGVPGFSRVMAGGHADDSDVMGERAPWLAYSSDEVTLLFLDHPGSPRYPTQWFARHAFTDPPSSYVGVSFALTYDRAYVLPPGETLALRHTLIIGDGRWPRSEIALLAERHARA